ncbi:hypothetical protein G7Z17_g8560 [Cylindrodendrum hubeiense]|uniref:Mfs allantoate protein n=1 Tax=Cylindrodendrum hubeiense TaxID=595255 RepID=A0A9P5H8C8_9HYPO|nr:hypothetical protein G7Z17_g8560 [Cylindrodendrum hubeiense]
MASTEAQCQALQLSDSERCLNEATNANGLFCKFHAKQVYGLYKGYKRRNARLDAMDDEDPPALKNSEHPLANETFDTIDDEKTLKEVHLHLFDKYVLLGKVIDARKLHHKHFYSLDIDYGHQAYLDKLSSQRHTVLRALGRLEKRTAEVLYQKEQWFTWVRNIQDEEEATGEKEQKKVKLEAALFKRHWKQLQARLKLKREKEDKKRQDAYLEDAFRERMAMSADESEDDETWDPIEDMTQDDRDRYIDLIKHFLWMGDLDAGEGSPQTGLESKTEGLAVANEPQPPKKGKKKSKAKAGAAKKKANSSKDAAGEDYTGQERLLAMQEDEQAGTGPKLPEPDKSNIETEEEMRKRLKEGVEKNYDGVQGWQLVGTIENPHETHSRTAPLTDSEIESAVKDISEIKVLLFCRLLLAQASMLPAALRASSVQEFLQDAEIAESDLRDLCLKVEKPSLQEIRDACADFARGDVVSDEAEEEEEVEESDEEDEDETFEDLILEDKRYSHLHSRDWLHDKVMKRVAGKGPRKRSRTKVTICGKSIWNHASEKAMSRDGWLQFSIMAKDCDLKHAIQLCRNWSEFTDLNILTHWQYFPASNWESWGGNKLTEQLQQLRVFPYFMDFEAQRHSRRNQVGGRTRGRRQHDFVETRNVLAVHMKRSDPVTRRFLQYLMIRTGELLVLVRDGKTGRVITAPPEEHLWTYRMKQGLGRASKSEWHNVLEVGPMFFDLTDTMREWRFGFDDYYDVFIWDFVPDQSHIPLYNLVISELRNAWRITHPRDVFINMKPLLQTLTREKDTMRTRQIKPGEEVESLWEVVMDERTQFRLYEVQGQGVTDRTDDDVAQSPYMFYNKANEVEDAVLFPDELVSNETNVPFREPKNGVSRVERGILPSGMKLLAKGLRKLHRDLPNADLGTINEDGEAGPWALPKIFKTGLKQLLKEDLSPEQRKLLANIGLGVIPKKPTMGDLQMMERDRAIGFKQSFHDGDLEPGATEKFREVLGKINFMLDFSHSGETDWVWFLVDILKWLKLRATYNSYIENPAAPWPHSYITQDLVKAFACMAMFFPGLEVTALVTKFIQSSQCEDLRNSSLFDPKERSKTRPDRRARTSYKFRPKEFWTKWREFMTTPHYYAEVYPMDWSIAIRPIIAHLYREGVITPAHVENDPQIIAGTATANTEPHRPDQLDLFICYDDQYGNFPMVFPPNFEPPDKWAEILPHAQTFAAGHPTARFGLLRLWSAPHYYPFMVGLHNRQMTSFLDSTARAWEWKFVPKDMPGSEFSAHNVTQARLEILQEQFKGRVINRGDLIFVMGENELDLLKYCTAVTFAMQTKPWLREIDLWKSFVNVDLDFLIDLDSYWMD